MAIVSLSGGMGQVARQHLDDVALDCRGLWRAVCLRPQENVKEYQLNKVSIYKYCAIRRGGQKSPELGQFIAFLGAKESHTLPALSRVIVSFKQQPSVCAVGSQERF